MLTHKQEAFVAKYLDTSNASEAYRHAYNTENMKDATIGNNAYMLLNKNSEVAAKIKEIKDKVLSAIVIDRKYITREVLDAIERAKLADDNNVVLKGCDQLSKMYDLNEDKQNDRMISNKDKIALVENYRQRMLDVTPEGA